MDARRRALLKLFTLAAGAAGTAATLPAAASDELRALSNDRRAPLDGAAYFPQSVASGDPRPHSVVLWTRVVDPDRPARWLRVQVARDRAFKAIVADDAFPVSGEQDFCLKVRLTGLAAGTVYYYRFLHARGGRFIASRTGRTKTAPRRRARVPVRFATLSCQDYIGRYYNTLLDLAEQPLDFFVHVGDYIYETTGDPSFQSPDADRRIAFDDTAGALPVASFFAARSLDNYRQLYRTYRSDPALQRLHERFPVIAIWDDHEFSDDAWQANGTFFDGRSSELDVQRKRDAERAYFEFMPIDTEWAGRDDEDEDEGEDDDRRRWGFLRRKRAEALEAGDAARYPDTRIYRSFRFGRNAALFCTDYRTFRPDHLIAEDAFPAAIALDRPTLEAYLPLLGGSYAAIAPSLFPYVAFDSLPAQVRGVLAQVVAGAYQQAGAADPAARAQQALQRHLAIPVLNAFLAAVGAPPIEPPADAPRGVAYALLGKTALFSSFGARYLVVKPLFDLLAAIRYIQSAAAQDAYGRDQDAWLKEALAESDARWKFVASSVSYTSMILDLTTTPLPVPAELKQQFYLNVDQWDGFPQQRREYLDEVFGRAGGVVILSGDIHASFATQHSSAVAELTTPAVSSTTFGSIFRAGALANPATAPFADQITGALPALLRAGNDQIRYAQTGRHGVCVVEADAEGTTARFVELPEAVARERRYDDPGSLAPLYVVTELRFDASGLRTV